MPLGTTFRGQRRGTDAGGDSEHLVIWTQLMQKKAKNWTISPKKWLILQLIPFVFQKMVEAC